jgi:hypothetical protein
MADTYELLAAIVAETRCKPGWSFRLIDEDGVKRLVIQITGVDNYDPRRQRTVNHMQPVPAGVTYNGNSWRRWMLEQCLRVMNHEIGESLRFGPEERRPFAPMHGPGEDPYTIHEIRSEIDALTTQDGSVRAGPV